MNTNSANCIFKVRKCQLLYSEQAFVIKIVMQLRLKNENLNTNRIKYDYYELPNSYVDV